MATVHPLGRFCGMEGRKCDTDGSKGSDLDNLDRIDDLPLPRRLSSARMYAKQ